MKKVYKLSMGLVELEDMLVNYLGCKGDYPDKVKKAIEDLGKAIWEEYYPNKEEVEGYYIDDINIYFEEKNINGKKVRTDINFDCIMLYNFFANYFGNKGDVFPDEVLEEIDKFTQMLGKYIPEFDGDIEDFYSIHEVTYKKEKFANGGKNK